MLTVSDAFRAASSLSHSDRAELAHALLLSLEPETEENVDVAWAEEALRRSDAIQRGESELLDWEEVKAEVLRSLASRNRQ
jgi:putative addiction module component (TIGR02574 family)